MERNIKGYCHMPQLSSRGTMILPAVLAVGITMALCIIKSPKKWLWVWKVRTEKCRWQV